MRMTSVSAGLDAVVIIPCYNHGSHLGKLLSEVRSHCPDWDILVVDDGSGDDTSAAAGLNGCTVLRHPENRGKGAALWSGIQWGLANGKDWFLFLDADGQHPPEAIPWFLQAAEAVRATFVMGNRLHDVSSMPYHRRLSNWITSWILSRKTGQKIHDSQCGFRLIHRSCLEHFRPVTCHYETETEILLHAARNGAQFASVNIPTIYQGQRSSIDNICDTIRFLRLIVMK
jgi:glycosyltransferase involved in cell wall biosynthesis